MVDKDVAITYDTLYEFKRIENNREDLQKLQASFFEDVLEYIRQKKIAFNSKPASQELLFERDDKEQTRIEFENIRKILKDIYDRREKKIVMTAINKSKAGVTLVNVANMLQSEKRLFNQLTDVLTDYRKNVLHKLFNGELPTIAAGVDEGTGPVSSAPEIVNELLTSNSTTSESLADSNPAGDSVAVGENDGVTMTGGAVAASDNGTGGLHFNTSKDLEGFQSSDEPKELKSTPNQLENGKKQVNVRFLAPIEEIVGPDLQIYGPYDEGAEITLPVELAQVLVEKQQAEKII